MEDFSFINFKQLLNQGNEAEQIVINELKELQLCKVDHKDFKYDLIDKNNKTYEVKSHNNYKKYRTFPAEVKQNRNKTDENSIPEYLQDPPDFIIQVDIVAKCLYIFSGKKLAKYVSDNKKKALPFKNSSATGILIEWKDKNAGFLCEKIYINK